MGSNPLRIGVEVNTGDVAKLSAAAQEVSSDVKQMADMFVQAGLNAKEAAEALRTLGYSAEEVSSAFAKVTPQVENTDRAIGGMTSRMGMARVEMAALTGSTGMAEFGFARLIASSQALAPLLSALFVPLAAIAFVDIIGQIAGAIDKMTASWVGYTKQVQEAGKEDIKWSQQHEALALTLDEAHQKLSATVKEQGQIAEESFGKKWQKALQDNVHATTEFYTGLGALAVFSALADAEEKAADRAAHLGEVHHTLSTETFDLSIAADKAKLSLLEEGAAAEKIGMTASEARIAKLKAELAALGEKQRLEERIADEEMRKARATGVEGAPIESKSDIQSKIATERIRLTNELATAEDEAAKRAATAQEAADRKEQAAFDKKEARIHAGWEAYQRLVEAEERISNEESAMFARAQEKDIQEAIHAAEKEVAARVKYLEDTTKMAEEAALKDIAIQEAAVTGNARIEEQKLSSVQTTGLKRIQLHEQINEQELTALRKLEDDKLAIEKKYLDDEKKILLGGQSEQQFVVNASPEQLLKLETLNRQIEAAEKNHVAKMADIDRQQQSLSIKTTEDMVQQYMKAFSKIDTAFHTFLDHILTGNKTLGASFMQMASSLERQWIESLAQRLLKYVENEAAILLAHAAGTQAQVAVTAAGTAQAQSITLAAHLKEVLMHAKDAAAGAWHWVMATVPFPFDLAIAPAAAAAAFAGTMAFAEQGAVVPKDMPIFAHAGEMVLPRNISEGVQSMVRGGGGSNRQNINIHFAPSGTNLTHEDIIKAVKIGIRKGQLG